MKKEDMWKLIRFHHELKFYNDFKKAHPEEKELMDEEQFAAFSAMVTAAIYLDVDFYHRNQWFFNQWRKRCN